ncbi:MAG: hypothetical protein SGI99_11140 [Pseudomonadota bacterium]|nr:hypothetical protein [Pseudomonadota bacterium]
MKQNQWSMGQGAIFGLFIAGGSFSAQADIIECDDCADNTYQAQALSVGVGDHLVYDLARGALKQFSVDCAGMEPLRMTPERVRQTKSVAELSLLFTAARTSAAAITLACKRPLIAKLVQPTAATQSAFESALSFYWLAGNSKTLDVDLAWHEFPDVADRFRVSSAFDIVSDYNARIRIAEWLGDGSAPAFADPLPAVLQALTNSVPGELFNASAWFNRGMHVIVSLNFVDGSRVKYDWELSTNRPTVVRRSGEYDGNVIPDPWDPAAAGTYRFSSASNAKRFSEWLVNQNVRVDRDAQSEASRDLSCTWEGEALHCRLAALPGVAGNM